MENYKPISDNKEFYFCFYFVLYNMTQREKVMNQLNTITRISNEIEKCNTSNGLVHYSLMAKGERGREKRRTHNISMKFLDGSVAGVW